MEKRVDIKTGFSCNNNCIFCVQAHNKFKGNRPFDDLKRDMEDCRERCNDIVLTGGEVTIRKDFLDIVRLAKSLGYDSVQVQTNGRMFSSMDFCRKSLAAGASEFAISIHGHDAELHDSLTRAPGSFSQTIKGIRNLKRLGAKVLTNTVVVKQNMGQVPDIANLLVRLKVNQFQLAFVHPMGNALENFGLVVPKISEAAEFIKKGIMAGISNGISVMAEAVPYCLMGGYEPYVSESHIPETEVRGLKQQNTDDFTSQRRHEGKVKFDKCTACRHYNTCEGPWREYPEVMGEEEFNPVK